MNKFDKFLRKLSSKERSAMNALIKSIQSRKWAHLDIKRLSGHTDLYRVRKGDVRIIFLDSRDGINMVSIERRSDTTYS